MNLTQYLLTKLAEESTEVAKEALKEVIFGIADEYMGRPAVVALRDEVIDFYAVLAMLNCRPDIAHVLKDTPLSSLFSEDPDWNARAYRKQCKVSHYALYSHSKGLLILTQQEYDYIYVMASQYTPSTLP